MNNLEFFATFDVWNKYKWDMRLCVTCGRSNVGRKFIGTQCEGCSVESPIVRMVVPVEVRKVEEVVLGKVRCWDCGEMYLGSRCGCKVRKGEFRWKRGFDKLDLPAKEVVEKERKMKSRVCRICGGINLKRVEHLDCVRRIKLEYNRDRYKNRVRVIREKLSIAEKLELLPEKKVCARCGDNKDAKEFYVDKKSIKLTSWCKRCTYKAQKVSKNMDVAKGYQKEYHAKYKNRNKKKGFKKREGVIVELLKLAAKI